MKKNILFFGTPDFAIDSLRSIYIHQYKLNYELKGVVTVADRISGRGQKKNQSAIKKEAKKLNLKIYEPDSLIDPIFIEELQKLDLDLSIVVAFKKIPKIIYQIPKLGTINLHASILPEYRGAAPINWAIINGEKQTGLTTFFINEKIDTGDIIMQKEVSINIEDHVIDLYKLLKEESFKFIKNTIQCVIQNSFKLKKQKNYKKNILKIAPKITKDLLKLNIDSFNKKPLIKMYNYIRGMSNYGVKIKIILIKSHTKEEFKKNIIVKRVSNFTDNIENNEIGEIKMNIENKNQIIVTNGCSSFNIENLKLENGKEISAKEFYNGFIKEKEVLNQIIFNNTI
ncbi:MAG: methionyl-tRNA formyltransferase [Flavobacteriales bacterium]|nr:methionyl-tRNA formyltransferase [Flavobacteriales bacterium]